MVDPPAALLEGLVLDGGWRVVSRIERPVAATGGCLSTSYVVVREDGTEAFLKALDLSHALEESADPVRALSEMTQAYLHEREVLQACSRARLTHVVLGLDSGYAHVEGHGPLSRVPYLILERADRDVRQHLDLLPELDVAWALRTLHHVAVGLRQLHSQRIYHQDTKPSNVLVFAGGERKVADLGQAVRDGHASVHDGPDFPGDPNYAPLELLMSQGTTKYTASGTTTSVSTNARSTGCQPTANGAIAVMPMATSGKIASQVSAARM